ncbi:MAG TPA: NAD(P)/FAD-dependent oxidoreductase [Xenococcaceae cyanobacterium]|jgi:predicted NAD/FAD-dependent oxidoreductase
MVDSILPTNDPSVYDVVIIGAGLSGLTCARTLQQQGCRVIILDKSRGVGGRVATRRFERIPLDHGLPALEIQGLNTENLIQLLQQAKILQPWQARIYELDANDHLQESNYRKRYIANAGITAIAKYLATDLAIYKQCGVTSLKIEKNCSWEITYHSNNKFAHIYSKKLVIAIPAPQTATLLTPLSKQLPLDFLAQLQSVTFAPCIAVMAEYDRKYLAQLPSWQGVNLKSHSDLAWIALDSSKRQQPTKPVFVLHSTPQLAQNHLETSDLSPIGTSLLQTAASLLLPWLNSPQKLQVHRWRYAIPQQHLAIPYLGTNTPLPLVCCGDWCQGNNVESALTSGLLAGNFIYQQIKD